jgi:hypothetical protein
MSEKEKVCRVCGCTDEWCPACIKAQGYPCHWVEEDLCSRCANEISKNNDFLACPDCGVPTDLEAAECLECGCVWD